MCLGPRVVLFWAYFRYGLGSEIMLENVRLYFQVSKEVHNFSFMLHFIRKYNILRIVPV